MSSLTKLYLAAVLLALLIGGIIWYLSYGYQPQEETVTTENNTITYVAIGDSYTIGLGVNEAERWPNILINHLKQEGIEVRLLANPAVSGYRVKDAITEELPVVQKLKPDFVTVLIGANDNFSQQDPAIYKQELNELLNQLQPMLSNPTNIVLITIPDYSKTPAVSGYNTSGVSQSVEQYNRVIWEEADKRGLKVADIFPLSQTMTNSEDYISDGLHPSASGYAKWEKVIFPVVYDLLKR